MDIEMSQTSAATATGSAAKAETLMQSFAQAGYTHASLPILQPAEPFLDLSGEDIRKSLYLTTDAIRRRVVPAARSHHSRGAGLLALRTKPDKLRDFAISGRCSAIAADAPASSIKLVLNCSVVRIVPQPTPKCWRGP